MELDRRKILVVGFGKTGKSVTRFLLDRGAQVTVNDNQPNERFGTELEWFRDRGARFILGDHAAEVFLSSDLIVMSPGVDPTMGAVTAARKKGIPIISEIELAACFISAPIIGITGTNGKTTTTTLITAILRQGGFATFMGGNIGNPLISFVHENRKADFLVVELSSFQLEAIEQFTPHVAILLNITEDHLDRYPSFSAYQKAKLRIFMNQTEKDFAIVNRDDPACRAIIGSLAAQVLVFSQHRFQENGMYADEQFLYFQHQGASIHSYDLSSVSLRGVHNRENMLAAIGAAEACGCKPDEIQKALEEFRGLEHRIEYVDEVEGIPFYNDSKATNIDALLKSLQSFSRKIILIAGGREKGGDYGVLSEEMRKRVRALVLMGEATEKFRDLFGPIVPTYLAENLEEAVQVSFESAKRGDTVLLSPGCASFDMFSNYEERGRQFKDAVRRLAQEHGCNTSGLPPGRGKGI